MIAEILQDVLKASGIEATIGELPGNQKNTCIINEYANGVSTEYFGDRQGSTIFNPVIKVVVRNQSYQIGKELVEAAAEALHRYHDDELLSVVLVGSPIYLGRSADHLHEFQATFNNQFKE